jgi:tetratricopeptide (TPR) repeat protein
MEDVRDLGNAYYQLARLRLRRDPETTPSAELDQAITYHKRAGANSPLWLDYKLKFDRLRRRTDPAAILEADEAVAIGSSLVKDHEDRRECRVVRASALTSRGVILEATRGLDDGGSLGASALTSLRMILEAIDQPTKAEEDFLKARNLLKPLVEGAGSKADSDDINDLGRVHYNLAKVRFRLGYADEAMADVEEAIALHERDGANPSTDDTAIPQLWLDLDFKCTLLANRKPHDYTGEANTAERLPTLRPANPYSAIRAARALASCTYDGVYGGKADNPAIQAQIQDFTDRTLTVLQSAAERGLIGVKELDHPVYKKVSSRAEFGKIRELLQKKR